MAIHIRNLRMGQNGWSAADFWNVGCVVMREAFLAGRWTDGAFSNQTEYDNNIVATPTDVQVSAAYPNRITFPSGGMSGYTAEFMVTLLASNDENRGVYRFQGIVDDNTILIRNPPATGWTTETGITGRIFRSGYASQITDGNWAIMLPPSGIVGARFQPTAASQMYAYAYGDGYPSGGHITASSNLFTFYDGSYSAEGWLNAYFTGSGPDALFYGSETTGTNIKVIGWCDLEGYATGDTAPGCLFTFDVSRTGHPDIFNQTGNYHHLRMIEAVGFSQDSYEILGNVVGCNRQHNTTYRFTAFSYGTSHKGKARLTKPWVWSPSALGGFPRGKLGQIRITNRGWENFRAMDASGTWRHLVGGLCVPMNGPNDPNIVLE